MPIKPTKSEEAYFAKVNAHLVKEMEKEKHGKHETHEAKRLRELHFMHCPKCGRHLVEVSFHGVMIDKCTGCDGIWLDNGELGKILARAEGKSILETVRLKIGLGKRAGGNEKQG